MLSLSKHGGQASTCDPSTSWMTAPLLCMERWNACQHIMSNAVYAPFCAQPLLLFLILTFYVCPAK
jgi:hypothetical protein